MITIYIPSYYKEDDQNKLVSFMREFDFATVVSTVDDRPFATHLPILIEEQENNSIKLKSHMAYANHQWKNFHEDNEILIIFQGPHSYISPTLYDSNLSVPTWNYAAVHVYGKPVINKDEQWTFDLLNETILTYEEGFETGYDQIPIEYKKRLVKELVGFEIHVTKIEGAFKLNQDKSITEQERISKSLVSSKDSASSRIGNLMEKNLSRQKF